MENGHRVQIVQFEISGHEVSHVIGLNTTTKQYRKRTYQNMLDLIYAGTLKLIGATSVKHEYNPPPKEFETPPMDGILSLEEYFMHPKLEKITYAGIRFGVNIKVRESGLNLLALAKKKMNTHEAMIYYNLAANLKERTVKYTHDTDLSKRRKKR